MLKASDEAAADISDKYINKSISGRGTTDHKDLPRLHKPVLFPRDSILQSATQWAEFAEERGE